MSFPPTYLQLFLIVTLPLMGLVYALLGGLKLSLADRLQLDEGKVGRLVSGFGMMVGPIILACGFLTDAFGCKGVFLTGAVLVSAAVFVLAGTRGFRSALLGVLLLGAGWSATVNVANVLMRVSADKDRIVQAINFYDCVFGFGAFVTPMVLGLVLRRLGHEKGLRLLAAVACVPVAMGIFANMAVPPAPNPEAAQAGFSELLSSDLFWLVCLAFVFYIPLENAVAGWATTLVARQFDADAPADRARRAASASLSGFWLCFTGSRLLAALLAEQQMALTILSVLSIASFILMLGVAFLRGRVAMVGIILTAGLVFGPIFPTMMAVLLAKVPPATMGRAVGFFFAMGSVGWTVIPALIGHVGKRWGIQRGFLVAAASGVAFVALVLLRASR